MAVQSKEKLLTTAQQLMQLKGFTATTIDEICESAGISKGGFFHYFENKEDLGKQALDHFVQTMQALSAKAEFLKKNDPLQRVYGYIDFLVMASKHPVFKHGCLLGNFSQELSNTKPEIRQQCAQYFAGWTKIFKQDLEQARAHIKPRAIFNTQSLAEFLIITLEGAMILAKANQDKGMVEKSMRHYKRYLKYLFEQ